MNYLDYALHRNLFEYLQHLGFESTGAWQHGMSANCSCMSASKLARTLKVAHGCKCQVAEHSKPDTLEDLKDLLKRVDNTLQQFDTVCGRELLEEEVYQLDLVTEGRQRSFQLRLLVKHLLCMSQDHTIKPHCSTILTMMACCNLPS